VSEISHGASFGEGLRGGFQVYCGAPGRRGSRCEFLDTRVNALIYLGIFSV